MFKRNNIATFILINVLFFFVLIPQTYAEEVKNDKLFFRQLAENNFNFIDVDGADPDVEMVLTYILEKQFPVDAAEAIDPLTLPKILHVKCGGKAPIDYVFDGDMTNFTSVENADTEKPMIAKDKYLGTPVLLCPVALGGEIVRDAFKQFGPNGDISLAIVLNDDSADNFTRKIAKPLTNKTVAMMINSEVYSAPVIQPSLSNGLTNNTVEITFGNAEDAEAQIDKLAKLLNPDKKLHTVGKKTQVKEVEIASDNTENETSGSSSLKIIILTLVIGFALVGLVSALWYLSSLKQKLKSLDDIDEESDSSSF